MADTYVPPIPFCAVDAHGQVVMRGRTLDLPTVAGCTVLAEDAPPGSYRAGDVWVQMSAQPSPHHVFDWSTKAWADPRTLDDIRAAQLAAVNAAFSRASAELIAGYPVEERQTWAAQEAEVLAWAVDDTTPTPYLDGIAAVRDIDPADMRAKTLEAVNLFRTASQWLVGTRQRLRDAINAPTATREQIEAIAWPTDFQE